MMYKSVKKTFILRAHNCLAPAVQLITQAPEAMIGILLPTALISRHTHAFGRTNVCTPACCIHQHIPEKEATALRASGTYKLASISDFLTRAYPDSAWTEECYHRLCEHTLLAGLPPAQTIIEAERAFSRMGPTSHNAVLILTHVLEVYGSDILTSGRKIPNVLDTTSASFQADLDKLMKEVHDAWAAMRLLHKITLLPSQFSAAHSTYTTNPVTVQ